MSDVVNANKDCTINKKKGCTVEVANIEVL